MDAQDHFSLKAVKVKQLLFRGSSMRTVAGIFLAHLIIFRPSTIPSQWLLCAAKAI